MIRVLTLFIVFLISFNIALGQEVTEEWEKIKKTVESMTDTTTYEQIVELLGKPYEEFATPSLPEEYILYFNIPNEPDYMCWIMLSTENKTFLYWGGEKRRKKAFERLKIWEDIRIAAKEKRIDFLLEISNDTIQCVECNEGEDWRSKEEFFSNHLEQIEISDTKEYSVYSESYYEEKGYTKRYRINYAYEGGEGPGYNLIYTILEGENGIKFQGVFSVL